METQAQQTVDKALTALKKNGAHKAHVEAVVREVHEVNVESNNFSLLRTTFDQSLSLRAIVDQRQAVMTGNQFADSEISTLAAASVHSAKAGAQDAAFDVAPKQASGKFTSGPQQGDTEGMAAQADRFLQEMKKSFGKVIMEQMILQFVRRLRVVGNTNDVHFEMGQSSYQINFMFTAKDGKKTSGMNYTGCQTADLTRPLMSLVGVENLMRQSTEAMSSRAFDGKFVGDIIVTPHCLPQLMGSLTNYLGLGSLMTGQSVYQNKLGEKIAVDGFTLRSQPLRPDFAQPKYVTADGHISENIDIIQNGVLKTFLLDQYGAAKLKKTRAKSDADYPVVEPGSGKLDDMIRSVKKGLLFGGFSGGYPASNGDMTGVAKNSFLIEDGEVKGPVNECMIACNIPEMMMNIQDISRESINFGNMLMPWIRIAGVTISGK